MLRRSAGVVAALATTLAVLTAAPAAPAAPEQPAAEAGPKIVRFVPDESDRPRLRAAWQRWAEARGTSYVTRVTRHCLACGPRPAVIRTEVRRNRLVAVHNQNNGHEVGWGRAWPMDRFYRLLRRGHRHADEVRVRYDRRGVPLRVAIDWDVLTADEETYLTIRAQMTG